MKLNVIELFSGIGAQSKALKNIGINHEVVATADWDLFANISYAAVHYNKKLVYRLNKWEESFGSGTHTHTHTERERERERDWKTIFLVKKTFQEMAKILLRHLETYL